LVEAMSFNPEYKDVKEVCSRANLNDLVDAMAAKVASENGIDPVVAALKLENAIWRQDNPYLWMYQTIKAHHPRYKAPASAPAPAGGESPAAKGREPKPAEAPPSVAPLGPPDTTTGTGWTAAKLDAMDELDYMKVPENIRQLYIAGELK